MKKAGLLFLLFGMFISCGNAKELNKTLVVYFSCTGTTEKLAEYGAEILKADLVKIEAAVPYTAEDIVYYTNSRADKEQNDPSSRPAIKNKIDVSGYDTIILGYPIWHGQAPKIIYTFLESGEFSGKTIIPFCTSYSSGIGNSDTALHKLCSSKAGWKNGNRFGSSTSKSEFEKWLKEMVK